jgi:surfeit locus 1 family protein
LAEVLQTRDHPEYAKVKMQGQYVSDAPVRRLFRSFNGVSGFRYLQLFEASDGTLIFVDRGFAPRDQAISSTPSEDVSLQGYLHPANRKGWLTPAPELENNIWYWRDTKAMAPKDIDTERFNDAFVIDLEVSDSTAKWPIAVGSPEDPVNNHFDYALTWFGLALALLVIYLVWHGKNGRLRLHKRSRS